MNEVHSAGTSSSGKIASTGQGSTHAPQSMHSSGSMKYISAASSVWMQSTGQTSTHEASFTPMQGWVMTYATWSNSNEAAGRSTATSAPRSRESTPRSRGRGSLSSEVDREVGGVPGEAGGEGLSPAKSGEYPVKPGEGASTTRRGSASGQGKF